MAGAGRLGLGIIELYLVVFLVFAVIIGLVFVILLLIAGRLGFGIIGLFLGVFLVFAVIIGMFLLLIVPIVFLHEKMAGVGPPTCLVPMRYLSMPIQCIVLGSGFLPLGALGQQLAGPCRVVGASWSSSCTSSNAVGRR